MSSIQTITDQHLIDAIKAAKHRVVFVAPGIWLEVAESLSDTWKRLGPDQVSIILDIDAEVCRFGYGSLEGLECLKATAQHLNQAIGHEPGIRICIVIADEQTFIFSPTPRLIESSPGSSLVPGISTPRANGIVLSAPPPAVEKDLGATPEQATERTIGLEAVNHKAVEAVAQDLKKNPPKTFDVARAVNVYNAAIQFVEFKVSGCQLTGHKASLPSELTKVARKNPTLDKKIDKSLRLIEDEDDLITNKDLSQDTIFAERKRIEDDFLIHVRGGTIIARKKKEDFCHRVEALQQLIKKFAARVSEKLNDRYLQVAEQLATELLPDVLQDIPQAWAKKLGSSPDALEVKFRIKDALIHAFGNPDRRISAMKATVLFKDVTYDMLKDPEFIHVISEEFPDLKHIEEYTAAKESQQSADELFPH
jgi:ribosome-associated translation inhibitor RaiA